MSSGWNFASVAVDGLYNLPADLQGSGATFATWVLGEEFAGGAVAAEESVVTKPLPEDAEEGAE